MKEIKSKLANVKDLKEVAFKKRIKLESECRVLTTVIEGYAEQETHLIENHLSEKFNCNCTGLYKMHTWGKRCEY